MNKNVKKDKSKAFTLAEVLITLGIIGVVAVITIPTVINKTQEQEYKSAYKKAYADISQAFALPIAEKTLTSRTTQFDATATASEWTAMKEFFKISQECTLAQLYTCWANGDKLSAQPNVGESPSFIDNSGRTWAIYYYEENIYLVDTNGLKQPNKFGKDRWIFVLKNADGTRTSSGLPAKVGIYQTTDLTTTNWLCTYPPCYYRSWLFE